MEPIFLSILVGVLTGVFANLVTNLFINVWLPAYRDYVYKGVRIQGDWILNQGQDTIDKNKLGNDWSVSITLNQKAYKLSGFGTAQRFSPDSNREVIDIIYYDITGSIFDRLVFLYLRPQDKTRLAHSSFHVEVISDGNSMSGYRTFYGLKMNKIRAVDVKLNRKSVSSAVPYKDQISESST